MNALEARARTIFMKALEHSGEEALSYLDAECAGDAELRLKVDRLLEAHREISSSEQDDIDGALSGGASVPGEDPGTLIGPYRVLEQIGEGGFGMVYMAEQLRPVRRKVALKIIKPGMDTRLVVARFDAERQALALMDHPSIAQVFDGGTTAEGRPYFVMELVRGLPITQFCDENRSPIRDRVELFVAVCSAVQHAHQKGIVHRDLKPSNILVTMLDDKPVAKVIDFGIAKALGQQLTDRTLFTRFAHFLGTPLYMSPEQAQLSGMDVDTRSDIYSLGVLLYELLTGATPFEQERLRTAAFDEVARIIREEDPPRPSTKFKSTDMVTTTASTNRSSDPRRLNQLIRGELDWIVMKCLEKDRNRRYETASGLGADLKAYLRGERVQACPPSAVYRLRIFARRYKTPIVTACAVVAISAIGVTVAAWQSFQAAAARHAATRAELALSHTRQNAAEERAEAIARNLESLKKANGLIESARSHLDFAEWPRAEADLNLAQRLQPEHSSVWLSRGDLYGRLRLWDLAAHDFQSAFRLHEPASLNSLYVQAVLRLYLGDESGYRSACQRMIQRLNDSSDSGGPEQEEIARACLLSRDPIVSRDRMMFLTQRAVESGKTPLRLACSGAALYRAERYEPAIERLEEAKATGAGWERNLADSILALTYHRLSQPEHARKALRSAAGPDLGIREVSLSGDLAANGSRWSHRILYDLFLREATISILGSEREWPGRWCDQANSLVALGRDREAVTCYGRALSVAPESYDILLLREDLCARLGDWRQSFLDCERLIELQPNNAVSKNLLAWRLATCPDQKYRDYKHAIELAEKAVELVPREGAYWNTLGRVRYRTGDLRSAERAALKSMEVSGASYVTDWFLLALCEGRQERIQRAKPLMAQALRRAASAKDSDESPLELRDEAVALLGNPGTGSASGANAEALEELSAFSVLIDMDPAAPWAYKFRADRCAFLKQFDQAAADFARAVKIQPIDQYACYGQAAARLGAGDLAGYEKVRTEILARFRDLSDKSALSHVCYICAVIPSTIDHAQILLRMAELAVQGSKNPRIRAAMNYRAGNHSAAIEDFAQTSKVYAPRVWDWLFLGMAHQRLGHLQEARRCLQRAEDWIERANRAQANSSLKVWISWYEPIEIDYLLREARTVIK
jgi:eukaryotic-like serine/threonine-protein kinase